MTAPTALPSVRAISPHMVGMSRLDGMQRVIKLSSNESPLGPGRLAREAMTHAFDDVRLYPESDAHRLRDAVAEAHGLDPARIVCGSGSDELMGRLVRAFAGPGDEVIHSANGYGRYRIHAQAAGAVPVSAPDRDLCLDVDAVLERVNARTRVVMVANPDNPSGMHVAASEVRRLHAGLPESCLLLLDCAYAEYVRASDYEIPAALVHEHANVVMTRTFSKVYGLAGLRLGWLYASASVVEAVTRVGPTFPVSKPALVVGIAALADHEHLRESKAHNARWLDWLVARLGELGLHVYPSQANFVLVRFNGPDGRSAKPAFEHLLAGGIIARRLAAPAFADCVRISIGDEAAMRATADALTGFMSR